VAGERLCLLRHRADDHRGMRVNAFAYYGIVLMTTEICV
jgi:hypothetical protein